MGAKKQRELARVREQPAQEVAERVRARARARPASARVARERRLVRSRPEARVHVQAAARERLVELRHERERAARARGDLLRRELVDHVPVGHLERLGIAQVDLVLARAPTRPC